MIKTISIFLCILVPLIAFADEDALREIMKNTYPELPIKSIQKKTQQTTINEEKPKKTHSPLLLRIPQREYDFAKET